MGGGVDTILTVGHSNHDLELFVGLFDSHGVTALADVRSTPYSRYNPQFNREQLADSLKVSGIKYVYLGLELGGRSDDLSCYERGRVRYDRLARSSRFRIGLERIVCGAEDFRVALMCAEKEPRLPSNASRRARTRQAWGRCCPHIARQASRAACKGNGSPARKVRS